ncbi:MAG: glycosyltransferase family 8 protein [Clostridia bacterium]|nr:glycosyltransferase family 8 protein [Clostridia bacterium]
MNILYCGDSGVCDGIFLSALSVCKNAREDVAFYILTAGVGNHKAIDEAFSKRLENATGHKVFLLDISAAFEKEKPSANMATRFTPLCMLRLFADEVSEIPDRILYLDADVLCRADFSRMYRSDMQGAEIAGVPDRYGKWFFGNIFRHDYLNSGVLLIDMAAVRKSGVFKRCRRMCCEKRMFMPDQTALNRLAKKKKLPSRYNAQGKIRQDTVFKHFTTFFRFWPFFHSVTIKPWQEDKLHSDLKIFEFDDILDKLKRSR